MKDLNDFYCSDIALEHTVPLIGTATQGNVWFFLEYSGRWGIKAFEESTLPQDVKNHLKYASQPGVRVRIILIRQEQSRKRDGFSFFVGQTSPKEPRLYEYQLNDYSELLELDLVAITEGQPGDPVHMRTEPLYLVCTNGLRDKCCARFGLKIYQAMTEAAGEQVWQSSHIGGHNKAPVLLFFPHGLNYGRTTPDETRVLMHAYQRNEIVLEFYRGRVCFAPHVQAAEYFWRTETGNLLLPGPLVQQVAELGDDQWLVTVTDADGGHPTDIHIQLTKSEKVIPITCTQNKTSPIVTFQRIEKTT